MYSSEEFYWINPSDLESKYVPYFEECFKVSFNETPMEGFVTFDYAMNLIGEGKVNHIYEYINMFFMFREQYDVIEHRYLMRDRAGNITETPVQMADRVATFVAMAEPQDRIHGMEYMSKWYPIFLKKLINMEISPNTPTWVSAGIPEFGSFACSVIGNDDSLSGISKWYKDTMYLNRYNFGIGHSLHKIRPEGTPFSRSKIKTKSSLNWLYPIQELAENMSQGASGRGGANMVTIPVWHPDVIEFITHKKFVHTQNKGKVNARVAMKQIMNSDMTPEQKKDLVDIIDKNIPLKNFNMSVLVNDAFMEAVERKGKWKVSFELADHSYIYEKEYEACEIYRLICQNAWESGDPGLLFYDRINKDNVISNIKNSIMCCNPCLSGDTMIITKNGHYRIKDLIGKEVEIFNGEEWIKVNSFKVTGTNKELFRVKLNNGQHVDATGYHKFILDNGSKKELKDLKIGDKLRGHNLNIHGNINIDGAYIKGFLLGDGTIKRKEPLLWLYKPKYCCESKLIQSAKEIKTGNINTNVIVNISAVKSTKERKRFTGLVPLSYELLDWCGKNRNGFPVDFLNWDFKSKTNFIAGYMDADGTAGNHNGFRYQVSSINKNLLYDFQLLLRSIGVKSCFSLMKKAEEKDFGERRGGIYKTKNSFRLTISQESSILLSKLVKFERLESFSNKIIIRKSAVNEFKIQSINSIGIVDKVYCCVTDITDRMSISNGLQIGRCGEIPMHSNSVCNLWTINLVKHIDFYHRKLSAGRLEDTIKIGVRMADNLTTVNSYPKEVPEIEKSAKEERRIGIDFTGLADYMYIIGMKFANQDSIKEIDDLYKFLRLTARIYSARLGKKKGNFPLYRKSDYKPSQDLSEYKKCPKCDSKIERLDDFIQCSKCNWAKFTYIRNMHLLTQAPTGTRARKLGVSFGIEPQYYKWYTSNVMEGKIIYNVNRILEWYLKIEADKMKIPFPTLCEQIDEGDVSMASLKNWVEAHELTPDQHLLVQATAQRWIDQGVSKTINLPKDTTWEEVGRIYMKAWRLGCKGITMYRDGSHYKEVIGKSESCPECDSNNLLKIEGCVQCMDCAWSKCSL